MVAHDLMGLPIFKVFRVEVDAETKAVDGKVNLVPVDPVHQVATLRQEAPDVKDHRRVARAPNSAGHHGNSEQDDWKATTHDFQRNKMPQTFGQTCEILWTKEVSKKSKKIMEVINVSSLEPVTCGAPRAWPPLS